MRCAILGELNILTFLGEVSRFCEIMVVEIGFMIRTAEVWKNILSPSDTCGAEPWSDMVPPAKKMIE